MSPQLSKLLRQHPSSRMKRILVTAVCLNSIQSFPQFVFPCNSVDSSDIVDGLMKMHSDESLRSNRMVSPTQIPISLFRLVDNLQPNFESNFPDNRIVGNYIYEPLHAILIIMLP